MTLKQLEKYRDDCIKSMEYWKNIYISDKSNYYAYKCYIHYGMNLDSLNLAITREKIRLNPDYEDIREKFRNQKRLSFYLPF